MQQVSSFLHRSYCIKIDRIFWTKDIPVRKWIPTLSSKSYIVYSIYYDYGKNLSLTTSKSVPAKGFYMSILRLKPFKNMDNYNSYNQTWTT